MTKNKPLCSKYDLSSVTGIYTGAAPLGQETAEEMVKQHPRWKIRQGYGSSNHHLSEPPAANIHYRYDRDEYSGIVDSCRRHLVWLQRELITCR